MRLCRREKGVSLSMTSRGCALERESGLGLWNSSTGGGWLQIGGVEKGGNWKTSEGNAKTWVRRSERLSGLSDLGEKGP